MSVVSLLLQSPRKGTQIARNINGNFTAAIFLDATLREGFSAPVEITQHPVEEGQDVSDHIILRPEMLSIEGVISNTPFDVSGQAVGVGTSVAAQIGSALGGSFGGVVAALTVARQASLAGLLTPKNISGGQLTDPEEQLRQSNQLPQENIRLRDAVEEFMTLRNSKQSVTIVTGLRQYENYYLTDFQVERNQNNSGSINVNLQFQHILVVASELVDQAAIPKIEAALPKQNQGRKNPTEVSQERSSILFDIFGGF